MTRDARDTAGEVCLDIAAATEVSKETAEGRDHVFGLHRTELGYLLPNDRGDVFAFRAAKSKQCRGNRCVRKRFTNGRIRLWTRE